MWGQPGAGILMQTKILSTRIFRTRVVFAIIAVFLSLFRTDAQAAISQTERNALIDIYNTAGGPSWQSKNGWLGAAGTECSWYGVTCNTSQITVIELSLGDNHLTGSIPGSIGNLANLQVLKMFGNQLSGNIPAQLRNLASISQLSLDYNALYSTDQSLADFVNSHDPGWQNTQTIAPVGISAAVQSSSSTAISWYPIPYTSDSGRYEVYQSTVSGGPYVLAGSTPNKSTTTLTATGLATGAAYYFVVRTVTDANTKNQNSVISEYSRQTPGQNVVQEITALENAWNDAAQKYDISWFKKNLADSYISTNEEGRVFDKAMIIADAKNKVSKTQDVSNEHFKVQSYGNTAVATGISVVRGATKGKDVSEKYPWTDTWIKLNGRWQCVASHNSKLPSK
jgi:ketosteroid isomerase-like protein